MSLYEKIKNRQEWIAIIGLGYVGLPLSIAFSKVANTIGFDINRNKIQAYSTGLDITNEVGSEVLRNTSCFFTADETQLSKAKVFIVAVPTPISADKTPNLEPVINASKLIGKYLKKGDIVVYESTVYPGVTEDICIKILESVSELHCGADFKIGYSPERINPSDKLHTLSTIKKIVSGIDNETLEELANMYEMVIEAGVHKAESIKVAEAAKVAENAQRDINIAFMNELAMVFDTMNIDTNEVIKAMNTKWNALGFKPGLVGGHCIGVDPYYFIYKAEKLGYHSQIISSGRKINDDMSRFISDCIVKQLIKADKKVKNSKVAILGVTFKENCNDIRNSKVIDLIKHLEEYGICTIVTDPVAQKDLVSKEYGIELVDLNDIPKVDAVVIAVPHDCFKHINIEKYCEMFNDDKRILIDIKSVIDKKTALENNITYWNL